GFSEPYGIAVSPDGTRAYVANRGNSTLTVIDTATNTLVGTPIPYNLDRGFSFTQVAVSPNGTKVFVVDRGDGRIAVIDPISRAVSFIPTPGSGLVDAIVAPDGTAVLVTAQFSNQLFLIDINPQSPTYQQVLQEVTVPLAGFIAFRGLPDAFAYVTGGGATGQVFVIGE
ncbi:MAG: YncE family protein, partial [bacterium]|nr:YncE family protein [bacterium]